MRPGAERPDLARVRRRQVRAASTAYTSLLAFATACCSSMRGRRARLALHHITPCMRRHGCLCVLACMHALASHPPKGLVRLLHSAGQPAACSWCACEAMYVHRPATRLQQYAHGGLDTCAVSLRVGMPRAWSSQCSTSTSWCMPISSSKDVYSLWACCAIFGQRHELVNAGVLTANVLMLSVLSCAVCSGCQWVLRCSGRAFLGPDVYALGRVSSRKQTCW